MSEQIPTELSDPNPDKKKEERKEKIIEKINEFRREGNIDEVIELAENLGARKELTEYLKKSITEHFGDHYYINVDIEKIKEYGEKLGMSDEEIEIWKEETEKSQEELSKEAKELDEIMEEWWEKEGAKQFAEDTEANQEM